EHDVRLDGALAWRVRDAHPGVGEPARLLARAVVADHAVTPVEEPLRHAPAHHPEPDEAERHRGSASATAIALISSLHRGCVARRDDSRVVGIGWCTAWCCATPLLLYCV